LDDWLSTKLPDITQAVEPPPGLALVVASWRLCADGPQRELIRAWFKQVTGHVLPASWVMRLHREVKGASAHWPMAWHNSERGMLNGQLVLYRGLLYWRSNATIDGAHGIAHPAVALSIALSFEQVGLFHVPQASGAVRLVNTQHKGVALQRLNACELRWRQGGEQFQMAPNRPARCLKKQFQAAHVPSWVRHQPLLWSGNQLIFVPGLGIDARAWAHEGEPQVDLAWLPDVDRLK
jgi:tRNA(Ile)-lysidine synthase